MALLFLLDFLTLFFLLEALDLSGSFTFNYGIIVISGVCNPRNYSSWVALLCLNWKNKIHFVFQGSRNEHPRNHSVNQVGLLCLSSFEIKGLCYHNPDNRWNFKQYLKNKIGDDFVKKGHKTVILRTVPVGVHAVASSWSVWQVHSSNWHKMKPCRLLAQCWNPSTRDVRKPNSCSRIAWVHEVTLSLCKIKGNDWVECSSDIEYLSNTGQDLDQTAVPDNLSQNQRDSSIHTIPAYFWFYNLYYWPGLKLKV